MLADGAAEIIKCTVLGSDRLFIIIRQMAALTITLSEKP